MNMDDTWWERQLVSTEYYKAQHEALDIDPSTLSVYRLFGSYLRSVLLGKQVRYPKLLDVGCGIFPKLSPAMEGITEIVDYTGLDPLPYNLDRDYPFVCAKLEDFASKTELQSQFDVFVFGTSLDHVEDLEEAVAAVRSLAAPDADAVFWNGLQDPTLIASDNGALLFRKIVELRPAVAIAAYFAYGMARLPRLMFRMKKRRKAIAQGRSLDHHFRWFTSQNIRESLSQFGEITDIVNLPNTNHSFATVRISR